MKHPLVKGLVLMAGLLMFCGINSTLEAKKQLRPVELKVMLFGTNGNDVRKLDEVLKEFEKRTRKTLNTKLNFNFSPMADYKQKLQLRIAAGEEMDLLFDAPFCSLTKLAPQGAYLPLDKYFNNSKYPGLKKAFSRNYLEANKLYGHIYGVPFTKTFMDMEGIFIRKDLREKYGLPKISNDDQLEVYLKKVMANEPGMVGIAVDGRRGLYQLFDHIHDRAKKNIYTVSGTIPLMEVAISKDGKKVLGVASTVGGDPNEAFAQFPAPYNKWDLSKFEKFSRWNKYLEKDCLVQRDKMGLFLAGKAAGLEDTLSKFLTTKDRLRQAIPGADLEFYPVYASERQMTPRSRATDYKAWNFVCIPAGSKKADQAMRFLDWLFASQKNHDLFEFGIEGKHWQAVGTKGWKLPDGVDPNNNYAFPGYELTWNPNYIRHSTNIPAEIRQLELYQNKPNTYFRKLLAGFTFDQTAVKAEITRLDAVFTNEVYGPLVCGIFEDPAVRLRAFNAKAKELGLDKIREEARRQVQAFLDNKNKKR